MNPSERDLTTRVIHAGETRIGGAAVPPVHQSTVFEQTDPDAGTVVYRDPDSGEVTMIDFPYEGPRRLRADADGNLWIVAFQNSLLVKYDPGSKKFTAFDLPVINELPYALNVDRDRGVVWVNGNQSDTILGFTIATESWKVYPMPRQRFFTRDIEVSEADGAVYTSNSHFPTWQSEGAVPTLLRITPLDQ